MENMFQGNTEIKTIFGRTSKNWYLENLKQGTRVRFNDSVNQGTGTICGISGNGVPLAGRSYIVQIDQPIEGFEYSHISLPEIYLDLLDEEGEKHNEIHNPLLGRLYSDKMIKNKYKN